MKMFLLVLIFLLGISWGSFLNVWIYRIPQGRSIAGGRSACMTCKHTLGALDLVPLFSFLFLRGRCRYCKTKLSWQYPLVELLVGLLFLLTYFIVGLNPYLWFISIFLITVNVVMAKIDWDTTLIPNVLSYPSIILGAGFAFLATKIPTYKESIFEIPTYDIVVPTPTLSESLIGGVVFFGLFVLIFFLSNGGLGMGDAKWSLFIGLMLGWKFGFLALLIATTLSSIFSLSILVLFRNKIKQLPNNQISIQDENEEPIVEKVYGISIINGKPAIVLGPFLAIGMLIAWFFGVPIYEWYINM